jgi:hypothetical protein
VSEEKPLRGRMHSYTLAALLGIFVVAVVLAVIGRLLPGRLSGLLRSLAGGGKDEGENEKADRG